MMKYSSKTNGFYDPELFRDPKDEKADPTLPLMPEDVIDVPEDLHRQCGGRTTAPGPDGLPMVVEPSPASPKELAANMRKYRNALLAETDWTEGRSIDDATFEKWAPYRKALRDLPMQAGFPETIEWPTRPDEEAQPLKED